MVSKDVAWLGGILEIYYEIGVISVESLMDLMSINAKAVDRSSPKGRGEATGETKGKKGG